MVRKAFGCRVCSFDTVEEMVSHAASASAAGWMETATRVAEASSLGRTHAHIYQFTILAPESFPTPSFLLPALLHVSVRPYCLEAGHSGAGIWET